MSSSSRKNHRKIFSSHSQLWEVEVETTNLLIFRKLKKKIKDLKDRSFLHNNFFRKRIGLFISIPKNGSKSILNNFSLGNIRGIENSPSLVIFENHQRGKILSQKYNLDNLFVFCLSRNPYDRTVSWFEYHKNIPPYCELNFIEWVDQGMPHHWVQQNQTNYLIENLSPLEQHIFIDDCKVDFIGKLENYSKCLNIIQEKLNSICKEKNINYRFKPTNYIVNNSKVRTIYE